MPSKEQRSAAMRRWYLKNPDLIKAKTKAWRDKNKEQVKEIHRKKHIRNRERILARTRAWKQANKDAVCGYHSCRKAMKLGSGGGHTNEQWRQLCASVGHRCVKCGDDVKLTRDHIIPLSIGGSNNVDNIQPLCLSCNLSKGVSAIAYITRQSISV